MRAQGASDPLARAKYATSGLCATELEVDTQVLLLRQLYLSYLEQRRYHDARAIAHQMLELRVLPEVAHQDAARADFALGDVQSALDHLRLASRACSPGRRSFHLWCLGSSLYALGCHSEAATVLERALCWTTRDRELLGALLALTRHALGAPTDLRGAYQRLCRAPVQPGVVDWVGGELLLELGERDLALALLRSFVQRNSDPVLAAGLRAEVSRAERLISRIEETCASPETIGPAES